MAAASRRHLQHSPLPRPRWPHQSGPHCRGYSDDRRRHRGTSGSHRRRAHLKGTCRGARRTAGHGLGDGAGAALRGNLFGNVVLSRHPIVHHAHYDLSWKTCEPRCLQRVDVAVGTDTLHLYNVHLGTAFLERRHQAGRLGSIVHDRRVGVPKLVLGDFNEWSRGLATKVLSERLESIDLRAHLRRRRTYPGVFPVLHLDHIYYEGSVEVVGLELPRTRLSLLASDHLPLVAELKIRFS